MKQNPLSHRIPGWISGPLVFGTFLALFLLERRRPLRHLRASTARRTRRNLAMAGITSMALQLTERPLISRLAGFVTQHRVGFLKLMRLPVWLEVPLAVVLMDYTLYWWHVLTHRLPWLWRFHVVHHVDVDLDASTAIRFHVAEMVISVIWRAGQVVLLGVSPFPLSIWQTLLLMSIFFHHSNVALPVGLERRLVHWIVTPRMHGIHHSTEKEETHSNWSSGLTIWDRLHDTLILDVPQQRILIGTPAFRNDDELTLPHLLVMPFRYDGHVWPAPGKHHIIGHKT